ncbi:MAG: 2-oxo acid dehydrogenase subunit E2 [Verrucomicrobia bacterium]|nr:2-oxo acid dehydrogenase subunit E2 [Verrucomicrobiota bacterium]MBV8279370.1 2-oxo acid dehydrogenase subunit E2 [Verrucomicrobiota bacterium]
MSITIEMPKLSDTMTEGTLVRWVKKVGDNVAVGDVLAEVETDKATMEMEAFDEGTLSEVYVGEGQTVQVGQKLALLLGAGESKPVESKPSASKQSDAQKKPDTEKKSSPIKQSEPAPAPQPLKLANAESEGRVKASPLARKVAAELGVHLETLPGSGPGGRIVRDDVISAHQNRPQTVAETQKPAAPAAIPPVPVSQQDIQIALGGMRRTIAARLLEAKTTIPHFYLQAEVDAEPLVQLRQQLNSANEAAGLPKFTVNDFILKATAVAAAHVPKANASFSGDAIVQYASVHLACAVAIDDGLVTPVIRDAQSKSLSQISAEIKDLAAKARSKKLKPEQYQGGTLTVSNLGSYGVDQFFAIINPPQSLIVSVGAILKKPVVNAAGAIVPGQRIIFALSCDHRVVDGAIGAQFLAELKRLIETPALMLV